MGSNIFNQVVGQGSVAPTASQAAIAALANNTATGQAIGGPPSGGIIPPGGTIGSGSTANVITGGAGGGNIGAGSGQPPGSVAPPPAAPPPTSSVPPPGGVVPPGGNAGGTGIPGVGGSTGAPVVTTPDGETFETLAGSGQSLDTLMQLAAQLQGTSIGDLLNLSLQSGGQQMPLDENGNFLYPQDILSSLGGIFGGNETMGLGLGEGGAPMSLGANISFGDFLQGAQRGQQREGLLGNIAQDARNSGAFSAGQDLTGAAQRMLDPNFLDDRFRGLEEEARLQNASSLNSQRNYLQDIGMAGGGMGQAPALLGAERGSARDLQSTLNQLDAMRAQEDARNVQVGTGAAATGTDIYRALGMEPQYNVASSLGGPQNIQSQQFQNTLSNIGQLASGTALAQQNPSNLQQLAPILGGGLGALGSIGGGLFGNPNFMKG